MNLVHSKSIVWKDKWANYFFILTDEDLNAGFFRSCTNKKSWSLLIECIKSSLILVLKLR